jgi:hypothetical protein
MRAGSAILPLYGFTIFLGAALLFLLQLVFARLALPLLGGAPAVWNTAMVFYQAVLLAGYGYAHWLGNRPAAWGRVIVHASVMLLPLVLLPFAIPGAWRTPSETSPVAWLLGLLAVTVGGPFFAVSTTGPLLQKWFAGTSHSAAKDPYFLYAASNAGSLLGLLAYPFLIEPQTSLRVQSQAWMLGFALLGGLSILCALIARKHATNFFVSESSGEQVVPTTARRLRWVAYGAVPSSLMLSVTAHISSEIAAVPLLWVIPLALYLATFIIAFSRRAFLPSGWVVRLLALAMTTVVMTMAMGATTPMALLVVLHLICFFLAALACHGLLAADRPAPRFLTGFYLWMSFGGVVGGAFTALIAPLLFTSTAEYPLMLVAAILLVFPKLEMRPKFLLMALLPGLLAAGVSFTGAGEGNPSLRQLLVFGIPALLCFTLSRDRYRYAVAIAGVLFAAHLLPARGMSLVHATRSFFGIHRVTSDSKDGFHYLFHGKTVHGIQSRKEVERRTPLGYYHPSGPLGDVFAKRGDEPVGAVGLGAGAVAAYGKPGQEMHFYEIDPAVKKIASNPDYFTYLSDSRSRTEVTIGDARLKLNDAPDGHFQLIVMDAYGSDSVPVHLLTQEAMDLYLRKLAPGGAIAFHISNLHLDLRPVIANLAADAGLSCIFREDADFPEEEQAKGRWPSRWAVMAREDADLGEAGKSPLWSPLEPSPDLKVWTDDHSSILPLLDLRLR